MKSLVYYDKKKQQINLERRRRIEETWYSRVSIIFGTEIHYECSTSRTAVAPGVTGTAPNITYNITVEILQISHQVKIPPRDLSKRLHKIMTFRGRKLMPYRHFDVCRPQRLFPY